MPKVGKLPIAESKPVSAQIPNGLDSNEPIPALFPSINTCAAQLFIPVSTIRWAKKQPDCHAFDSGSRVRTRKLLYWLNKRDEEHGDVNWGDRLKEYQAKREKIKLDKENSLTLDQTEAAQAMHRAIADMFGEWDKLIKMELPMALVGQNAIAIEKALSEKWHGLKEPLRAKLLGAVKEAES